MKRAMSVALALCLVVLLPPAVAHADRSDDWAVIADQAIADFEANDSGNEIAHAYVYMLGAIARRHGWTDPRIPVYLDKVYDLRNPDGGWGLGYAYDKSGDGTVNPATTTYTVTVADHVGLVFLDAYQAGLVPASDISTLVNLVMTTQTATFPTGQCVAFSRSGYDNVTANNRCVNNVNALAAWWLQKANALGFQRSGLHVRILNMARHVWSNYHADSAWWSYYGTGSLQDADHNAATAEALYAALPGQAGGLGYPIGREAAYQMMTHDYDGTPFDSLKEEITHMRLTGLPAGPGSMSGNTTLWCVLGDDWLEEAQDFVDAPPSARNVVGVMTPNQARAQAAYWAARNADVC